MSDKKEFFPVGFEHGYADTMVGVVRTALAIVGVAAFIFFIGVYVGYMLTAR
jgi:hypothetical protein